MILCKIRSLNRAIAEYEVAFVDKFHLSLNEGMLLCALNEHQQLFASQIAQLLDLTMSNTSKIIKSVEDKKLIERFICSTDKRQMCFQITLSGKELLRQIESEPIPMLQELECAMNNSYFTGDQ